MKRERDLATPKPDLATMKHVVDDEQQPNKKIV